MKSLWSNIRLNNLLHISSMCFSIYAIYEYWKWRKEYGSNESKSEEIKSGESKSGESKSEKSKSNESKSKKCLSLLNIPQKHIKPRTNENNKIKIIFLSGLQGAGKSSLIFRLNLEYGSSNSSLQLVPFSCAEASITMLKGLIPALRYCCNIYEVPEMKCNVDFWNRHMRQLNVKLITFVVDSSDRDKLPKASLMLKEFLSNPQIPKLPVLIVATKQDRPDALKPEQIIEIMDVTSILQYMQDIKVMACQAPRFIYPDGNQYCHDSITKIMKMMLQMM